MKRYIVGVAALMCAQVSVADTLYGIGFSLTSDDPRISVDGNVITKTYNYSDSYGQWLILDDDFNVVAEGPDYAEGDHYSHTGINETFSLNIRPDDGQFVTMTTLTVSLTAHAAATSDISMGGAQAYALGPLMRAEAWPQYVSYWGGYGFNDTFIGESVPASWMMDSEYRFPEIAEFSVWASAEGYNTRVYYTLNYLSLEVHTMPVPEPSSYALFAIGLGVLLFRRKNQVQV